VYAGRPFPSARLFCFSFRCPHGLSCCSARCNCRLKVRPRAVCAATLRFLPGVPTIHQPLQRGIPRRIADRVPYQLPPTHSCRACEINWVCESYSRQSRAFAPAHPLDRIALAIATLFLIVTLARLAGLLATLSPGSSSLPFFYRLAISSTGSPVGRAPGFCGACGTGLIVAFLFFAGRARGDVAGDGEPLLRGMLFQQLAEYLLVQDIQARVVEVANTADSVASAMAVTPQTKSAAAPIVPPVLQGPPRQGRGRSTRLELDMKSPGKYLASSKASSGTRFSGIVQSQGQLWLVGESPPWPKTHYRSSAG